MYRVVITIAAELNVFEATDYYETQLEGLGVKFYQKVIQSLKKLEVSPEHYSFLFKDFRSLTTEVFPFLIVFKILPGNQVVVFGVIHISRNPEIVQSRIEK